MCQIFTAEHETSLSLRVCCGLGLLFVCCTLLLLAQASPLTPKLWREVMWAKTATTTKLCTLKATTDGFCTSWIFFTRVHTLFFQQRTNEVEDFLVVSSITSNMLPDSCHMCCFCWKGKWSIFHVIFHYYWRLDLIITEKLKT